MNTAVQAGPAANAAAAVNLPQVVADPAGAEAPLAEGGFRDVLEKRLQSTVADAGTPAAATATPAVEAAGNPVVALQLVDSGRIAADAMAAFLAGQPAAPALPPGTATLAAAEGFTPAGGRLPAAATVLPAGDAVRAGLVPAPTESAAEPAAAAEARAAIGAAAGKALPQPAVETAGAFRGLLAEAAAAARSGEGGLPQVSAGEAPPLPNASHAPAATAPGPAAASDVRVASTQVATPFGRPEWTGAMNERVTWLVAQRMQSADIQINPPQLGPVEVRITVQNDQANLFFTAHNAAVREAIQAALPRLGEMLAQGGLSLGQASVGAESFAGQQQSARDGNGNGNGRGAQADVAPAPLALQGAAAAQAGATLLRGRAGVDMFV